MVWLAKCFNSTPHTNERETELHPTCWHQSEVHPHSDEQRRRFPLRAGGFSPFSSLLSLNLTPAHFELCMYPIHQGKTHPHVDEAHLTSNISDPSLQRHRRNTSLKPTLYNTWSTSLQTHLPFLLFYHSTSPSRSRRQDRCPWSTHDRSLSFSIYLSLSLNFWSLFLPPSLSLTELWSLTNGVVLIFVFYKFIYWNFLL